MYARVGSALSLAIALLAACSGRAGQGAPIVCDSDWDCPMGSSCDLALRRCFPSDAFAADGPSGEAPDAVAGGGEGARDQAQGREQARGSPP